jgi:hypothetical protein
MIKIIKDLTGQRFGKLVKNDAICARLQAEAYYFKEFAPQKELFEKYGIITNQND